MPRIFVLRRGIAAVSALILCSGLSGCAIGFNAGTSTQKASGNGANVDLGALQIRGITIVTAPDGTTRATLIGTIVNGGPDDALVSVNVLMPQGSNVTLGGASAMSGTLPLPTSSATRLGYEGTNHADFVGLKVDTSAYVDIELVFQNSGRIPMHVLTVAPIGIYANIAPLS